MQSFTDIKPALRYLAGDETKISQSKIGLYHYFLQTKTKEKIFKRHHRYWESKSLFTIINNMKCSGKKKIVTPNADFWPDYYLQLKKNCSAMPSFASQLLVTNAHCT